MAITIKELAEKANVSVATISRALNDSPRIKAQTKSMILTLAKDLNYIPNVSARNLVMQKSYTLGLILPEMVDEFFSDIVKGVDEIALANGYNIIVAGSHKRTVSESIMKFMGKGIVDGIILLAPSLNGEFKEIFKENSIPFVLINAPSELNNCDTIGIDNFQGAYSITEYLITARKYKKIAHISGPLDNNEAVLRKKGFLKALKDSKIELKDEWLIEGNFTIDSGEYACRRLLSLFDKPEVVFAANDMMAIGCYNAIKSFGLSVPQDIAVAGFDDIFVSQFLSPRLTTVHVPIFELGKIAANVLINRIENGDKTEIKNVKISTGLIIGLSC